MIDLDELEMKYLNYGNILEKVYGDDNQLMEDLITEISTVSPNVPIKCCIDKSAKEVVPPYYMMSNINPIQLDTFIESAITSGEIDTTSINSLTNLMAKGVYHYLIKLFTTNINAVIVNCAVHILRKEYKKELEEKLLCVNTNVFGHELVLALSNINLECDYNDLHDLVGGFLEDQIEYYEEYYKE